MRAEKSLSRNLTRIGEPSARILFESIPPVQRKKVENGKIE